MRVPLYVSLPIIAAFGAVGFVASVEQPGTPAAGTSRTHDTADLSQAPVTVSAVEGSPQIDEKQQLSAESTPPPVAASPELPLTDQVAPAAGLTPAPAVPEYNAQQGPQRLVKQAQPPAQTKPERQQARVTRVQRPETNAGRPQRTAQQRPSAPYSSSASVKSIPLIGPVLSLFQ